MTNAGFDYTINRLRLAFVRIHAAEESCRRLKRGALLSKAEIKPVEPDRVMPVGDKRVFLKVPLEGTFFVQAPKGA